MFYTNGFIGEKLANLLYNKGLSFQLVNNKTIFNWAKDIKTLQNLVDEETKKFKGNRLIVIETVDNDSILQYQGHEVMQYQTDDEIAQYTYYEYYFKDNNPGMITAQSPSYNEANSEYIDAIVRCIQISKRLRSGERWIDVYRDFIIPSM